MRETLGRETLGRETLGRETRPTTSGNAESLGSIAPKATAATAANAVNTAPRQPPSTADAVLAQATRPPNKLLVFGSVAVCVAIFLALVTHLLVASNSPANRTGVIGTHAPNFIMTVWNGANGPESTLTLSSLHGHPIVLDFWSPTNLESEQMAQTFEQLSQQYAMFGVDFVGVAVETDTASGQAFMRKYGLTFPNGPDPDGNIATAYALPGLPDAVFITSQGTIADTLVGLNTPDELDYIIRQDLLDGIPPLPTPGN